MIKFDVLNRLSGEVQFTAEIECSVDEKLYIKLGMAVEWALKNKANLREVDLSGVDLRWANLSEVDLSLANLSWANLSSTNLSSANLSLADLREANLSWADLSLANLSSADLREANLRWANLSLANLSGANLSSADLREANLSSADLSLANLSGADLREVIGNNNEVITIMSGKYLIVLTDTLMSIGCEQHTIKQWLKFTKKQTSEMDGVALEWWTVWNPIIKSIIDAKQGSST